MIFWSRICHPTNLHFKQVPHDSHQTRRQLACGLRNSLSRIPRHFTGSARARHLSVQEAFVCHETLAGGKRRRLSILSLAVTESRKPGLGIWWLPDIDNGHWEERYFLVGVRVSSALCCCKELFPGSQNSVLKFLWSSPRMLSLYYFLRIVFLQRGCEVLVLAVTVLPLLWRKCPSGSLIYTQPHIKIGLCVVWLRSLISLSLCLIYDNK